MTGHFGAPCVKRHLLMHPMRFDQRLPSGPAPQTWKCGGVLDWSAFRSMSSHIVTVGRLAWRVERHLWGAMFSSFLCGSPRGIVHAGSARHSSMQWSGGRRIEEQTGLHLTCGNQMSGRPPSTSGTVSSMMAGPVVLTQYIPREGWFAP